MLSRVELFGLNLNFYGLIIGLGIVLGAYLCVLGVRKAKEKNGKLQISEEWVWAGMWWALAGGILGARLYHVIDEWSYYSNNLLLVPAVWNGGLGIYGAMLGGVVGLFIFSRIKQLSLLLILDIVVLGLPLGQVIGRWGNFVNQELYGLPTSLPWGIIIRINNRLSGYEIYEKFHPLFLYEGIGMLMVLGLIWRLFLKDKYIVGSGGLAAVYLIGYGLVRFLLDPLRIVSWRVGGVAVAQLVSGLVILAGVFWLVRLKYWSRDEKRE